MVSKIVREMVVQLRKLGMPLGPSAQQSMRFGPCVRVLNYFALNRFAQSHQQRGRRRLLSCAT